MINQNKQRKAQAQARARAEREAMLAAALQCASERANQDRAPSPTDDELNAVMDEALLAHRRRVGVRGGPQTPEGKQRSAQNSFRHGLATSFSGFRLLPGEDAAEYSNHLAEMVYQYRPVSNPERAKIEDMARSWWLTRRSQNLVTEATIEGDMKAVALFMRYEAIQRRAYQMAHKDFQEMKKARIDNRDNPDTTPYQQPGIFQSEPVYPTKEPAPEAQPEEAPPDRQAA